jgi:hypothetical protein
MLLAGQELSSACPGPPCGEVASAISYDVPQEEQATSEIIMEVPIFTQETV